jgi:hypothetical protein
MLCIKIKSFFGSILKIYYFIINIDPTFLMKKNKKTTL